MLCITTIVSLLFEFKDDVPGCVDCGNEFSDTRWESLLILWIS